MNDDVPYEDLPYDGEAHELNKKRAKLDQAIAKGTEMFPMVWRSLYENCLIHKFTEEQALKLVCTYIKATHGKKAL